LPTLPTSSVLHCDAAMTEIPQGWPPEDSSDTHTRVAPVFPLRDVFLFPGQLLPLHIFEPRYRQMVEDSLDGPGRIVMVSPNEELPPLPQGPVLPEVAGIGEIVKHERLPDGRFRIWLVGIGRVRANEVPSDRLYRKVEFEPIEEQRPTKAESAELNDPLHRAILERVGTEVERDPHRHARAHGARRPRQVPHQEAQLNGR
jgi:Lon protease-like protein